MEVSLTTEIIVIVVAVIVAIALTVYLIIRAQTRGGWSGGNGPAGGIPPLNDAGKSDLVRYFNRVFPAGRQMWSGVNELQLEKLYLSLDSWYETIIPRYKNQIVASLPKWAWNRSFVQQPGIWNRLFDGDACDCLRSAFPQCIIPPSSRFRGANIEQDCPEQEGLRVGTTYETILLKAFNTNNTSTNFVRDKRTVGGKGYPSYSWFEGLTYTGEWGLPMTCSSVALPDELRVNQPGLQYRINDADTWKELKLPFVTQSPWFDTSCEKEGPCSKQGIPIPGLTCLQIKSDGSYPAGSGARQGKYCVPASTIATYNDDPIVTGDVLYAQEMLDAALTSSNAGDLSSSGQGKCAAVQCSNGGICDLNTGKCVCKQGFTGPKCDCRNFPQQPCTLPDNGGYHGIWLYPLRGIGVWRNVGNSVVTNSKLGFLMTTYGSLTGYTFNDLLPLVSRGAGAPLNIHTQISTLANILYYGTARGSRLRREDLRNFDVTDALARPRTYADATRIAMENIARWFMEGYTGIGAEGLSDGFNYNSQAFFPVGMFFSYAAALDNLTLAKMTFLKLDSLQLMVEPQSSLSGLRPAYYNEIFLAAPTPRTADSYSVYTDKSQIGCGDYYLINPMDDLDNYMKYGYVRNEKAKSVYKFDYKHMPLTTVKADFQP